jgi:hypothetical protein
MLAVETHISGSQDYWSESRDFLDLTFWSLSLDFAGGYGDLKCSRTNSITASRGIRSLKISSWIMGFGCPLSPCDLYGGLDNPGGPIPNNYPHILESDLVRIMGILLF